MKERTRSIVLPSDKPDPRSSPTYAEPCSVRLPFLPRIRIAIEAVIPPRSRRRLASLT